MGRCSEMCMGELPWSHQARELLRIAVNTQMGVGTSEALYRDKHLILLLKAEDLSGVALNPQDR